MKIGIESCIGHGAQGAVWAIKKTFTSEKDQVNGQSKESLSPSLQGALCLKVLDFGTSIQESCTHVFREIFGGSTSEVRIAQLRKDNTVGILMHRYSGTLSNALTILEAQKSLLMIRNLYWPVVKQLLEMHQMGLSHRDIKPNNIVVDPTHKTTHLIDFGIVGADVFLDKQVQSLPQRPPEILDSGIGNFKSDVQALGLCMVEAWMGPLQIRTDSSDHAFQDLDLELEYTIAKFINEQKKSVNVLQRNFANLLESMIHWLPEERPSMQAVVDHPVWTLEETKTERTELDKLWSLLQNQLPLLKQRCKTTAQSCNRQDQAFVFHDQTEKDLVSVPLEKTSTQAPLFSVDTLNIKPYFCKVGSELSWSSQELECALGLWNCLMQEESETDIQLIARLDVDFFLVSWASMVVMGFIRGQECFAWKRLQEACIKHEIMTEETMVQKFVPSVIWLSVDRILRVTKGCIPPFQISLQSKLNLEDSCANLLDGTA